MQEELLNVLKNYQEREYEKEKKRNGMKFKKNYLMNFFRQSPLKMK